MTKPWIALVLTAAFGQAQSQPEPAKESQQTVREKGYHETSPKNKGATPAEAKKKQTKEKASDGKSSDSLRTQAPPTRQPELAPPNKP